MKKSLQFTGKTDINFDVQVDGTYTSQEPVVTGGKPPYKIDNHNTPNGTVTLSDNGILTFKETKVLSKSTTCSFNLLVQDSQSNFTEVKGSYTINTKLNATGSQGAIMVSTYQGISKSQEPFVYGGKAPYKVTAIQSKYYKTISVDNQGKVIYEGNPSSVQGNTNYVIDNVSFTVSDSSTTPAHCEVNIGVIYYKKSEESHFNTLPGSNIKSYWTQATQKEYGSDQYTVKLSGGYEGTDPKICSVLVNPLKITLPEGKITYEYYATELDFYDKYSGQIKSDIQITLPIGCSALINYVATTPAGYGYPCNDQDKKEDFSKGWETLNITSAQKPNEVSVTEYYPVPKGEEKTVEINLNNILNTSDISIQDLTYSGVVSKVQNLSPYLIVTLLNKTEKGVITFNTVLNTKKTEVTININTYEPWDNMKTTLKPFFGETLEESQAHILSKANFHNQVVTMGSLTDLTDGYKTSEGSTKSTFYMFANRHWAPIQIGVEAVWTYSQAYAFPCDDPAGNGKANGLAKTASGMENNGYKVPVAWSVYTFPGTSNITKEDTGPIVTYFQTLSEIEKGYDYAKVIAQSAATINNQYPVTFIMNPDGLGHIYKAGIASSISFDNEIVLNNMFQKNIPSALKPLAKTKAGLADYVATINAIIRYYAPKSPVGWIMSSWSSAATGGGSNWIHNADMDYISNQASLHAEFLKNYIHYDNKKQNQYAPDFLALSVYGSNNLSKTNVDAGLGRNVQDFKNWFAYIECLNNSENLNRYPIMLWQVPGGHIFTKECDFNTVVNGNPNTLIKNNSSTLPNFLFGTHLQAKNIPEIQSDPTIVSQLKKQDITKFPQLEDDLSNVDTDYSQLTIDPKDKDYNFLPPHKMYSEIKNILQYIKQPTYAAGGGQDNTGIDPKKGKNSETKWNGYNFSESINDLNLDYVINKCNIFCIMWGAGSGANGIVHISTNPNGGVDSKDDLGWLNNTIYNYYMSLKNKTSL